MHGKSWNVIVSCIDSRPSPLKSNLVQQNKTLTKPPPSVHCRNNGHFISSFIILLLNIELMRSSTQGHSPRNFVACQRAFQQNWVFYFYAFVQNIEQCPWISAWMWIFGCFLGFCLYHLQHPSDQGYTSSCNHILGGWLPPSGLHTYWHVSVVTRAWSSMGIAK